MAQGTENRAFGWTQFLLWLGGSALVGYLIAKLVNYLIGLVAPKKRKRRIFISHSWSRDSSYRTLINRFKYHTFDYYNHSIPEENALDENSTRNIENGIRNKIWGCSKVLVLASSKADTYWIKKEVEIAKKLGKQVIAIKPSKSTHVSSYLRKKAHRIVDFNAKRIIELIER